MNVFLEFAIYFAASELLLTLIQIPLRKRELTKKSRIITIVVKALLAVICAFIPMAGPVQLRFAQPFFMAMYFALFADAIADAVYSIIICLSKKERRFAVIKSVSVLCGILFFAYGIFNMETVKPKYHTYTSSKLESEHTIVFLADLHVGGAQPFEITEKTVNEIKESGADATVLGGDIVDDYTTKEEMEAAFALFADFDTPVYYVYGNHDRQGHAEYAGGLKFTREELEKAITDNGIIILQDEFAELAPDVLLLGREDLTEGDGRADISSLKNPAPEKYLVTIDHQPAKFKDNIAVGTDLQLSGHTHAGQFFPLGELYSIISYNCGDYKVKGAVMQVTPGACGWRMPARTSSHCRYEVITLKPE